jgi:hypothetical protein
MRSILERPRHQLAPAMSVCGWDERWFDRQVNRCSPLTCVHSGYTMGVQGR